MSIRNCPPFRAEHVGSLIRPPELLDVRYPADSKPQSAEVLREIEDRHIKSVIRAQEEIGLQSITDGEFRREC